jgi:hypothetical protein
MKELKLKAKENGLIFQKDGDFTKIYSSINFDLFRLLDRTDKIKINEDFSLSQKDIIKNLLMYLSLQESAEIVFGKHKLTINDKVFESANPIEPFLYNEVLNNGVIVDADLINKIGLSVSTDLCRHFMTGVFFDENGNIVATDARRLSLAKTENVFGKTIVNPIAFSYFKGEVLMQWDEKMTKISQNDNVVYIYNIDSRFPNYPRVIPDTCDYKTTGTINLSLFKNEKLYKDKDYNKVIFNGDSVSSVLLGREIGKVSNPFIKASFNGLYLKDIIKQHGEEVSVSVPELNSEGFVSKCCRFGDDNYFTIVMPLN